MEQKKEKTLSKAKLTKLLKTLKDGDNFEREKAMEQIIAAPSKTVVNQVIPLLEEKATQARMAAWEILKKIGLYDIDAVTALLDHESEDVRVYVCEILGTLKADSALPLLIKKIYNKEENENVRTIACTALSEFDDDRAVNALIDALHDDEWIMFSAIESLGKIRNKKSVKPLLNVFQNGSEEVSLASCEVLMGFNDTDVVDGMLDVLEKWDQEKRDIYIKVILEHGDESVFLRIKERIGESLFEHLLDHVKNDENKSIHMMSLLAHFETQETCRAILDVAKSMNPDNEEYIQLLAILEGLKEIWKKDVVKYMTEDEGYLMPLIRGCEMATVRIDEASLLKVFLSSSIDIKREIIRNIPVISEGKGITIIKEAIKDPDGHVKGDGLLAVGIMSVMELKDDVIEAARKGFSDVRMKALKALIRLTPQEAAALSAEFVAKGSSDDKKVYLAVADSLDADANFSCIKSLLDDSDEKIRKAAIGAMGNFLDDKRYMDIFIKLLTGKEIPHEVLKVIKDKRLAVFSDKMKDIFESSENELWTRYYALSALSAFEDATLFDVFAEGLQDSNNIIKIGCLKALSDLNDFRALDHIRPFVLSEDDDLRSTAEMALGKLEGW